MNSVLLIIAVCFFLLILSVCIITVLTSSKDTTVNQSRNQEQYNKIEINTSPITTQQKNIPKMTKHASQRMSERLGVIGNKQTELMNEAFTYGRTSDRASGDLKIALESAEKNYNEETIAKFYRNSIYIFTAEDNILKTVYQFNREKNFYH